MDNQVMEKFNNLLDLSARKYASDVYFVANQKPSAKVHGNLEILSQEVVDPNLLAEFVFNILPSEEAREKVAQGYEFDIIYRYGENRFRTNIHLQQGMFALSIRIVASEIPTPEFLGFPPIMIRFAQLKKGLILLTGSTASGKSSVIASLLNMINSEKKAHIITIEDPIEFIYPVKQSVIEQRQIGVDSHSFYDALRASFRQDPDVIMIGELRDLETIETALMAAETGHLVFATIHSSSTVESIERIVNMFPAVQVQQILNQISSNLVAVVSRELLKRKDGKGRIASYEIMINTPAVSSLIREHRLPNIISVMQMGAKDGMMTMSQSKAELRSKGLIE
ncbi:PilT/PilU family type 4a pilus ATPase [Candidatus Azambacteria bacterium]|nr:PilT/PilU family type 4a pilus ATPase [Candidatus Azambacteria bacterium]